MTAAAAAAAPARPPAVVPEDPFALLPQHAVVAVAMSGGVDSSVAAARCARSGRHTIGITLAMWPREAERDRDRGCCSVDAVEDARRVATAIGIPHYSWNLEPEFQRDVVSPFGDEYAAGRTPNPCVRCNERIKFAALLDKALALGFDAVATGHYARVVTATDGRRELHRAADPAKDQSYVLGVLDGEQLSRSFFPLGDTTKPQIREEAAARGFFVAGKPDSHDICFIPDGDTRGWLTARLGEQPGDGVDTAGQVVGHHTGAYAFTVGQRRGLGRSRDSLDGEPRFVVGVETASNTVVIGTRELLGADALVGTHARWCGPPPEGVVAVGAQLRAHGEEVPATAWADMHGSDEVHVRLAERVRGVAPGQSVVLYDGTRVVGSATIRQAGTAPAEV